MAEVGQTHNKSKQKNQKSDQNSVKRRRININGNHRWTDAETRVMLQQIAAEVKGKLECFEKPSAQSFYKKIAAKTPQLKCIQWIPMKNKMRHLRAKYVSAVNWRNQIGANLLTVGDENSVEEYIEKICPKWDYLEQIFGQKLMVNPSGLIATSIEKQEFDVDDGDDNNSSELNLTDDGSLELSANGTTMNAQEPASNSQSSLEFVTVKDIFKNSQLTNRKDKNTNPLYMGISMQEKMLEIENKRFELEKEVALKELQLKKIKLEHDFEIRKRQVDSEERIRKYELEIKWHSLSKMNGNVENIT